MQKRIAANLLPYYGDRIYIAKVYDDLVTPNVLVMERVRNSPLGAYIRLHQANATLVRSTSRLARDRSKGRSLWTV